MHMQNLQPPLSLYIHIPWCIKKCPYCDFNSHTKKASIPEKAYINQLIQDLSSQLCYVQDRPIHSIFIGGGTPSLLSPQAYAALFKELKKQLDIPDHTETTLEANPGSVIPNRFQGYREAGINRISLGVQSFQDEKLKALGRIHDSHQAIKAIHAAQKAGFEQINIDLMFGLPDQNIEDALSDLENAILLSPAHISWYQLTLEPNTYFHRFPPTLPSDDDRFDMQAAGIKLLNKNNFKRYEVSAYSIKNQPCQHNLNYWQFGDYLGIGAGAHAKFTDLNTGEVTRRWNTKHPTSYLKTKPEDLFQEKIIDNEFLPLEFMMNALRLKQPISIDLFESRTGLTFSDIQRPIGKAMNLDLLNVKNKHIVLTQQGRLFLNDVLGLFLN